MRAKKPPKTYEPIACPICLATFKETGRLEKLWLSARPLVLCCDVHGFVITPQFFSAIIAGAVE